MLQSRSTMQDFIITQALGKGSYGSVYKVRLRAEAHVGRRGERGSPFNPRRTRPGAARRSAQALRPAAGPSTSA